MTYNFVILELFLILLISVFLLQVCKVLPESCCLQASPTLHQSEVHPQATNLASLCISLIELTILFILRAPPRPFLKMGLCILCTFSHRFMVKYSLNKKENLQRILSDQK